MPRETGETARQYARDDGVLDIGLIVTDH